MLNGQPATQVCSQIGYASLLPADLDGKTLPPAGTPNYIVNKGTNALNVWRFEPNFASPVNSTFTGPTVLPVSTFTSACGKSCVSQPGTAQKLDALGDRLMYRLSYRNLGARQSLVVNHSVVAGSVIGIRWYELDATGGVVSVRQQSTYAPNDGQSRWMGSAAIDQSGNITVGYTMGSSTVKPAIRFAGRDVNDPLNTLSIDESMQPGTGSQLSNLSRWGDYSTMAVDPVDDCTFWYTSEYLKVDGTFNWSTHVGSLKFSSCGNVTPPAPTFALAATPPGRTITQGQSTSFGVTVTAQNGYTGAGSYSVTGLPANASGSFVPTTYSGGSGSSTLTIATAANTPAGSYPVTITATDSPNSLAQSTVVTLTVNAAAVTDFAISASPGTRVIKRGDSGAYSVVVTPSGGFAENVAFSVADLPSGVTFAFSPASVNGGGSSTLTVGVGAGATKGNFTLTITGTGASKTRSTTVSLKVN